ncbi:MAG: spore maturation protein [Clostridia bacterium]|nr:spore maturation protein [Clostridia bacterium]
MNDFASVSVVGIISAILLVAFFRKKNVFCLFTDGALDGLKTMLTVAPSIIGLVLMVTLMQKSGLFDFVGSVLNPLCEKCGFPVEVLPLALIRPVSGSGALAVLDNILENYPPDEFIGKVASVMMGSTETTFYVIAMYFGSVNITKVGKTVACALLADITGIIMSVVSVSLFL